MAQQVFAVRIGDKYGPEFQDYINSKIPCMNWIREPFDPRVKLQWNKLYPMSLISIDEPVVVIDIDTVWINDYMDIINYPIERGEFLSVRCWWNESDNSKYKMQGGFQKYYPKDCWPIFDTFMEDPEYWQEYYIKNGTTVGPVNGEQYFVYDQANMHLKMKYIPETWTTKWITNPNSRWISDANIAYPGLYLHDSSSFNPEIRMIHLQNQKDPNAILKTVQELS